MSKAPRFLRDAASFRELKSENFTKTFINMRTMVVPEGIDSVQTTGYSKNGWGAALYTYDATITAQTVAANTKSMFLSSNGRGFRLAEAQLNVAMFGAVGDGIALESDAILAAVDYLPTTGGVILIPSAKAYKLDRTISDKGKSVTFTAGATTIIQPPVGWMFDLGTNGSSFIGSGRGATILKLVNPTSATVLPQVTPTIVNGSVTAITITNTGSNLYATPLSDCDAADGENDAAVIPTVGSNGRLTSVAIVVPGKNYKSVPFIGFRAGGAGAIKSNEIQNSTLSGFSVDMSNVPNATALYLFGGWYAHWAEIDVMEATRHETAISCTIDSHTLGVPGTTGSYGGAYVNRFSNCYFGRLYCVGHDTSTGTTHEFNNLDVINVIIHGCIAFTFTNPVVQTSTRFFDLVNVDGLSCFGGDLEGSGVVLRVRGSCNNIRFYNTLAYSVSGPVIYGPIGTGWYIDFARTNSTDLPIRTGSGGSAGCAFQNTDTKIKHRYQISPYSLESWIFASTNIRPSSQTQAVLDDVASNGMYACINSSLQFVVKYAAAGNNPVTTKDLFTVDQVGLKLPSSAGLLIGGKRVLGQQQPDIPNSADATQNAILAVLRAHGLIGTGS